MTTLSGVYVSHASLVDLAAESVRVKKPNRATGGYSGSLVSRIRGRGVDLDEVRLYQAGDDVRSIDWKVTARKQKTHTKVFREERERPTMIVVDQTDSMFFGSEVRLKSVAAAEIASRIAWQTLNARDRVGGVVIGRESQQILKPIRTKLNVIRFLKALSEANNSLNRENLHHAGRQVPWSNVLTNLRRVTPIGHRIVFISDFQSLSDVSLDQILVLRNHNELSLIHVYDRLEKELPRNGMYAVTNGVEKVTFYSGNTAHQANYENRFTDSLDHLRKRCQSNGVRFASYATHEDTKGVVFNE